MGKAMHRPTGQAGVATLSCLLIVSWIEGETGLGSENVEPAPHAKRVFQAISRDTARGPRSLLSMITRTASPRSIW